jgi:UDPglucose 6-dehydrogenase
MKENMKVAMIGCGKLGLPCAEVMAEHYDVVGYDVVKDPDALIPMLDTIEEAVQGRDIIFVAVPTPHHPMYGGESPISDMAPVDFDYGIVIDVLQKLNLVVTNDQMIVLISTVLPGTTRRQLLTFLQRGRFVYNPYLIAMGSVKWDMVNPECLIIGTEDGSLTGDAQELIDFYKPLMKNEPRINIGTWDEAEAIKIFYNTFISAKIGMVNMIQDVAERNGNINVDVVTDALKAATQRITGPKYLTAGMGDAGACHPRDNIALRWLAKDLNLGYDLFQAIMGSRDAQAMNMAHRLTALARENNLPIVIHGKAYKPYVEYTIGSYSLLVGHYAQYDNIPVTYADPLTGDTDYPTGPAVILLAHNPAITYAGTGVEVDTEQFYFKFAPGSIVVDPWRTVNSVKGCKVIHYGNPKFSRPAINGAFLSPVYSGSIFRKINDTFNVTLDTAKPAFYFVYVNVPEINFEESAEILITKLKGQIQLKESDRFIFLTQYEGIVAHGQMFRNHLGKFWPEITDDQYIYANELLSHDDANELAYPGYKNHLSFISINEWIDSKLEVTHDYAKKDKWFLNYNRVLRTHRCQLVAELKLRSLTEHGLISFVPTGEFYQGFTQTVEDILDADNNVSPEYKEKYIPLLQDRMVIDDYNITTNGPVIADHYETTILSVVTETTWNQKEIFISEKTFKAIANGHPFIIVGPAGFLKKLRELGFKTFTGVLNEYYDEVEDHNSRLGAVADEIQRLCNLDAVTKGLVYRQLSTIAYQNKEIFEGMKDLHLHGTLFEFLQNNSL